MPPNRKSKYDKLSDKAAQLIEDECLKISFEYLDFETEEFFIHGLDAEYYKKLFETITTIKASKACEIKHHTHPSLRPKSIFRNSNGTYSRFPCSKFSDKFYIDFKREGMGISEAREKANEEAGKITKENAFEITIGLNHGRIHGFIWSNTFHIVWFDPAHNLYPGIIMSI